jgi:UDP:flavonoid glycosyltransferase YjiC (YdhE family)
MDMKILLALFGSRGDVNPMIALAERLDPEGRKSLIAGPGIMSRLLNDAGRVITGTATLSKISSPTQRADYVDGARRAHRALNRTIEIASAHEFADLPTLAQ